MVSQRDEIRKFNYHGDVYFLFGEVTGRREGDGRWLVDVPVRATNQRGEDTIKGTTVIELPSREHGAVLLPEMLAGLQRRAVEMMSRHGESLRGGGR